MFYREEEGAISKVARTCNTYLPPVPGMKRSLGDDISDCDDGLDELASPRTGSPSQSCHSMDRKRRRGVSCIYYTACHLVCFFISV